MQVVVLKGENIAKQSMQLLQHLHVLLLLHPQSVPLQLLLQQARLELTASVVNLQHRKRWNKIEDQQQSTRSTQYLPLH